MFHTRLLLPCTLLLLVVVVVHVHAEQAGRCTYGAAGDLVGHEIYLNRSTLAPPGRRRYRHRVPALQGCALNGVSARVCDLYAPEVEVEGALTAVSVRRLGPRLRPLRLDVTLYCDPLTP